MSSRVAYIYALLAAGSAIALIMFFAIVPAAHAEPLVAEGLVFPFHQVKLSSPVEAVVREVKPKEGDRVKEGEVLAILYSSVEKLDAEQKEKVVAKTEFTWHANERLVKEKIVSEDKALTSKLEYELAVLESKGAQARIEEKTLRAPFNGQIIRVYKEEGETVARTQEVFHLIDYSKVYVQAFVEAKYLHLITEGMRVQAKVPLASSEAFDAEVTFVDPVVDAGSGLFRVKLLVPNADFKIKPGLTATITFPGINR